MAHRAKAADLVAIVITIAGALFNVWAALAGLIAAMLMT
jgi:hypothetical protein